MPKTPKITRRTFKKSSLKTFGFFLFFSALVWVLVQLSKEYTEIVEIPLEYTNTPLDKSISKEKPLAVEARMEGKGFKILYYQLFKPSLEIDLEQAREEGLQLVYSIEDNREIIGEQLNFDFENTRFLVNQVRVDFQPKMKKKLKVIPNLKLSYAVGFSAQREVQLSPDSVDVTGPENILDTLEEVNTVELSINNVNNNVNGEVAIDTSGLGMLSFYTTKVAYSQEVEKFTEGTVKVEVEVQNVPPDINLVVFPKEVLVHYQVNLKQYELVSQDDFKVVADYNDIREGEDYFMAEITEKPDFVTNIRLSERRIQFVIKR